MESTARVCFQPRGPQPVTEGWLAPTHINSSVEYLADNHSDKFTLRPQNLVMEAQKRLRTGLTVIVLNKIDTKSCLSKLSCLPRFHEKAPLIFKDIRLYKNNIRYGASYKLHIYEALIELILSAWAFSLLRNPS